MWEKQAEAQTILKPQKENGKKEEIDMSVFVSSQIFALITGGCVGGHFGKEAENRNEYQWNLESIVWFNIVEWSSQYM